MSVSKFATLEDYYRDRTQQLEKDGAELLDALEGCLSLIALYENAIGTLSGRKESGETAEEVTQALAIIARHKGQQ